MADRHTTDDHTVHVASVDLPERVIAELRSRGETVAVAESLTGGLVVAALVGVPGASAVVRGGVVAYATPIKHTALGVSAALLAQRGAGDPDVAAQLAAGVRERMAVDGIPATWGVGTTGVAGPEPQDGQPVGTVFVGVASASGARTRELRLSGGRAAIRQSSVDAALQLLLDTVCEDRLNTME